MAASISGILDETLQKKIHSAKVLVVGAGGIGCEVLKNLVMTGFKDIEIIDLDTIDLSNLNRQFLFHREHVGKSKAMVARLTALEFNPDATIKAYHDSITSTEFGITFFKKFNIVLNALDNRAARNHVNRMCLNAAVPLIESGTAGYNGQVELIQKGFSKCYECTPKAVVKSYPGCTIRNTPSEPIHCIVWAKHLFNQLFGESVEDEDISPDVADPEAQKNIEDGEAEAGEEAHVPESGNVVRVNTRQWAYDMKYDAETLFNKFFYDDIEYLLSMGNLWKTRIPPTPIKWGSVKMPEKTGAGDSSASADYMQQYHKVWTLGECAAIFASCLGKLCQAMSSADETLVWDKDDQPGMDFVAACANIRAHIFNISCTSCFTIKAMAGNIIPAIASTNSMTAGLVVMMAFQVLRGDLEKCKSVYVRLRQNPRQRLLVPELNIDRPNPNCIVCSAEPAINLRIDTKRMTIKNFRDDVLIKELNMVNPDVIVNAKGVVVLSSEEGETTCNEEKLMCEMDIVDGVLLKVDDFFQSYELSIIIMHFDAEYDQQLFEVIADKSQLQPKTEANVEATAESTSSEEGDDGEKSTSEDDGPSTSKKKRIDDNVISEDDDDLILIENDDDEEVISATDKLQVCSPDKAVDAENESFAVKRKPSAPETDEDVMEVLDSSDEDGPTQIKRKRVAEPVGETTEPVSNRVMSSIVIKLSSFK